MEAESKPLMSDANKFLLVVLFIIAGWLLFELSPVLMPFFIATLFAYLGDPLVDKLESWKLSRTMSVSLVFAAIFIVVALMLLVMLPLLSAQIAKLFTNLPDYLTQTQRLIEPWLNSVGLPTDVFNFQTVKQALSQYWSEVGQVAGGGGIRRKGIAALVAAPVLQDQMQRYAAQVLGGVVPVVGHEDIIILQGHAAGGGDGLGAQAGGIGAQLAGALQIYRLLVEGANQRHMAVAVHQPWPVPVLRKVR